MKKAIEFENKAYIPSYIKEYFNCAKCDLANKKPRYCKLLQSKSLNSCPLGRTRHSIFKELKGGV